MIIAEKTTNERYTGHFPDGSKRKKYFKLAMEAGQVEKILDVLEFIPMACLSRLMEINPNTLRKRLLDPNQLTMSNVMRFATIINIDSSKIFRCIAVELDAQSSRQTPYDRDEFKQYESLKLAMEAGRAQRMRDVIEFIPITCLYEHMDINYNTLCKRLLDPNQLTMSNILRFAVLTKIDSSEIFRRIADELSHELKGA